MKIPIQTRPVYDELAEVISESCGQFLSEDYRALCLRLLEKLCRKRPSPLLGAGAIPGQRESPTPLRPTVSYSTNQSIQIACYRFEFLKKQVEATHVVLNSEHIRKNFSVRVYDAAVVLVSGNINADVNHGATLRLCI